MTWTEVHEEAGQPESAASGWLTRRITIGSRTARTVPVRALGLIVAVLTSAGAAFAQPGAGAAPTSTPFAITDNSFLVEEAFNQEAGIFQNIFGATRIGGRWAATFTQEWPAPSQTHQLSYTVGFLEGESASGIGDALVNYRYQASLDGPGRAAFSPRLSVILPTGSRERGLGGGAPGIQVNLPVSKQFGDWYIHWNGGLTWLPQARPPTRAPATTGAASLVSPFVAASGIYRLREMWHVMLESVLSFDQTFAEDRVVRDNTFVLSPGIRGGWNRGDSQVVVGLALPVSWTAGDTSTGAFLYFSYELPFGK